MSDAGLDGFLDDERLPQSFRLTFEEVCAPLADRALAGMPALPASRPDIAAAVNAINLAFDGCEAEGMLLLLDRENICVSSGSACTTGSMAPSHVLTAPLETGLASLEVAVWATESARETG